MLKLFDNHPVAGLIVGSVVTIGAMVICGISGALVGTSVEKLIK